MAGKSANEAFDARAFWADVEAWRRRREISKTELSYMIDVDRKHLSDYLNRGVPPSLLMACKLAYVVDLDLNHYVKGQSPDEAA